MDDSDEAPDTIRGPGPSSVGGHGADDGALAMAATGVHTPLPLGPEASRTTAPGTARARRRGESQLPRSRDPGRYRLGERLGEGGMGEVLLAHDEHIGRQVAIKRLRTLEPSAEELARFIREARVQGRLEHPAVVPVHELAIGADGRPYFAMKRLTGTTMLELLGRLRDGREPDPRAARQRLVRAFVDVCLAIEFAHQAGVVHRDLKPANVMLVPHDEAAGGEHIKIVDFGIAKLTQDGQNIHTRTGSIMGTPIYMSPEQCRGAVTVDEKSDVYSFGIMLYEMLVGRPPFVAEGQGDLIAMHMFAPPPPLGSYVPGAPPELLSLMERILAKDPAARPSMALVATELQRLCTRSTGAKPAIAIQQTVRTVAPMAFAATTPPPLSVPTAFPSHSTATLPIGWWSPKPASWGRPSSPPTARSWPTPPPAMSRPSATERARPAPRAPARHCRRRACHRAGRHRPRGRRGWTGPGRRRAGPGAVAAPRSRRRVS